MVNSSIYLKGMKKRRKNFLLTLVLMLLLWTVLGAMIYWVEPELVKDVLVPGLYLPFFMIFFPTSFLTLAVILDNSRRGLLVAGGLTGFLILRVYQLGNLLNLVLILSIMVAIDRYWQSKG